MDDLPSRLSIREVAERSGCSASALRYYEAQGLIAPLPRGETYARTYSPKVLAALEVITSLRGAGFGITQIREFMSVKQRGPDRQLESLLSAIEDLSVIVARRRAALDKADTLLREWHTEIEEFRRSQEQVLP